MNKNIFRHEKSQKIYHSCTSAQETTRDMLPQNMGVDRGRMNQENGEVNASDGSKINFRKAAKEQIWGGGRLQIQRKLRSLERMASRKKEIETNKNYLVKLTFWEIKNTERQIEGVRIIMKYKEN